ncbi:hypothetical protein [Nemorincola caseinilytica]
MSRKKILLLTLVHPDFLPPVYALAQVLRDEGCTVHILTFDSYVPSQVDLGDDIVVETVGKHYGIGLMQRLKLRRRYTQRARVLVAEGQTAIVSFCAFTLLCGLKIKGDTPLVYNALEVADFMWSSLRRSPLSQVNNLMALRKLHKADLLATPSVQRSAWLAGRCNMQRLPHTVLNAAYLTAAKEDDTTAVYAGVVPAALRAKKVILYTGAVNQRLCILEMVQAFCKLNDSGSALVMTGMKDNEYCGQIKTFVAASGCAERILLLPYVTRTEMLALQANADIGVCLMREYAHDVESAMIAPNKVGEYLVRGLYLLACRSEYMMPMAMKGIAALADTAHTDDVAIAMKGALQEVNKEGYKERIREFVRDFYCMQQQAKPIVNFILKKGRAL